MPWNLWVMSDRREQVIVLLLVTWTTLGLFVDAWSHAHVPELESFFTPWHALFYLGFLATAAWLLRPVVRARHAARGASPPLLRGHGLSLLGTAVFAAGGLGDMVWHTLYGLEAGVAVLVSPPHLLLFVGLMLMTSAPLRHAWLADAGPDRPSLKLFLPVLLSLALTMSVVHLMLVHLWGFAGTDFFTVGALDRLLAELGPTAQARELAGELLQQRAISGILITNLVVLTPPLLLVRRWRPPFWSITFVYSVSGALIGAVSGLWYLPVLILAGLVADWLVGALGVSPWRPAGVRMVAVVAPAVLWSAYFLLAHLNWGVAWPVTLWLGVIMLAATSGAGLSLVAIPGGPVRSRD